MGRHWNPDKRPEKRDTWGFVIPEEQEAKPVANGSWPCECGMTFKTEHGRKIHAAKAHK